MSHYRAADKPKTAHCTLFVCPIGSTSELTFYLTLEQGESFASWFRDAHDHYTRTLTVGNTTHYFVRKNIAYVAITRF